MVRSPLRRYYRILNGEDRARYLDTKEQMVQVDLATDSTEALWMAHADGPDGVGEHSMLELKAELAGRVVRTCTLCERRCGVSRTEGLAGWCGVLEPRIASDFLHMGEEPDLVPSYTVFFSGCTFDCVYCQNHDISRQPRSGRVLSCADMAERIDATAARGTQTGRARNVNWVGGDPTPNLAFILAALSECNANTPQIWNSNMYMSTEALALLDGVIDVYLADFKYGNDRCARRLSDVQEYMRVTTRNHLLAREHAEMVIRHLVLPGHLDCCTRPVLEWIAENLDDVLVNVMDQYHPEHRAREFPDLIRPLETDEYEEAVEIALELDLALTR